MAPPSYWCKLKMMPTAEKCGFQLLRITAVVFLLAFSNETFACTLCHTATGKQVRDGILGPDFGFNLIVTMTPFVIFLGIAALLYYGIPGSGSHSGTYPKREIL